jgi:hypothetical protein
MADPERSQTGRTAPGMTDPLGRYTVTVTAGCDGGSLPDPAAFTAAADQAAWSRSASIISAHLTATPHVIVLRFHVAHAGEAGEAVRW